MCHCILLSFILLPHFPPLYLVLLQMVSSITQLVSPFCLPIAYKPLLSIFSTLLKISSSPHDLLSSFANPHIYKHTYISNFKFRFCL